MVLGPVLLAETVEEVLADMWVTLDAEAVETLSAMVRLVYDFEDTQPNPMEGPIGKLFIDILSKHQQCDSLILDPLQEDVGTMFDRVTEVAQLLPRFGASLYVAMVEGQGMPKGRILRAVRQFECPECEHDAFVSEQWIAGKEYKYCASCGESTKGWNFKQSR
jgi:hypothetical protein